MLPAPLKRKGSKRAHGGRFSDKGAAVSRALCQQVNTFNVVFDKDIHEMVEVVSVDDHVLVQRHVVNDVHGRSVGFKNGLTLLVSDAGQHVERIPQLDDGKRPVDVLAGACSRLGVSLT